MEQQREGGSPGGARMVDIGSKPVQRRTARAGGVIRMAPSTVELIRLGRIPKGDVLGVARLAGIQAAKQTSTIIPLCHPLTLDWADVQLSLARDGVRATSEVHSTGRTGVEMEALLAVTTALLSIYDMCKGVDGGMCIGDVSLLEKTKSDAEQG